MHRFVENNYDACYVTLFNSVQGLKELFSSYGFKEFGKKTDTGEVVMIRTKRKCGGPYQEYPAFESFGEKFLLGIHPKFHTQLFPDSKLSTEKEFVTEDLSETNSITKVYLTNMYAMRDCQFQEGDKLIIYRTADRGKAAEWSAVATSVGTITAYKNIDEFASFDEFKRFTTKYSIFTNDELLSFWKSKRYPYVIKFIYNAAFPHRVTRHDLIEKCGIDRENYAGFMHLSDEVFSSIIKESDLNEGYVIN